MRGKKMKPAIRNTLLASAIAATLGLTAVAFAGPHDCGERASPQERLEKRLDRMSHHLDLSDSQRAEVEAVMKGSITEMDALRTQMSDSKSMLRQLKPEQANFEAETARLASEQGDALASLIQLRAKTKAAIYPILTSEQRDKMQNFMDRKHRHKDRHRSYL